MVRLVGLIEGMASALQVPGSRVRSASSELRKHKLLRTGPRGPGAPEMGPEDGAALLLALMYDDELSAAAQNVQRLTAAKLVSSHADRRGNSLAELPPHELFRTSTGGAADFGQALVAIIRKLVESGGFCTADIPDDVHLEIFNLTLSIDAPGHRALIRFNNFDAFWSLAYQWKSAEQVEYETGPVAGLDLRRRWDALRGPYMSSSRVVDDHSLHLIADCLRGGPLHDECEETVASEEAMA